MTIAASLFGLLGGLSLFLYGMKVMSEGIQQAAGDRMQNALNFMTKNRFIAVFTGLVVTAIVQSSSAVSVMLISFVNAGLLTLTQTIGVTMGANIGTTATAWIASLIGFQMDIATLALPTIGIGYVMKAVKWKHQDMGEAIMGFGLLFLGLEFLTNSLPKVDAQSVSFISSLSNLGFLSNLIGLGVGMGITLLMHSSSATITLIITLAHGNFIKFDLSAAMILGANIGTTIDAVMAAIGAKTAAKRTALFHVLFNVVGAFAVLIVFTPFVELVDFIVPGPRDGDGVTTHLAMFHTVFNIACTVLFLPFVNQIAAFVTFVVRDKDKDTDKDGGTEDYRFVYQDGILNVPELAIVRAAKEIRDMAGLASLMYGKISRLLELMKGEAVTPESVDALVAELAGKENYADQMREELTVFLIECSRGQLNRRTEYNITQLLHIIGNIEEMTDVCFSMIKLLERCVKKDRTFKAKETEALSPYVALVEEFLDFVRIHVGSPLSRKEISHARDLEEQINASQNKLRKLGRKRIQSGANVKRELLFIDLVRSIEKLGDYCYDMSGALSRMK
ncbi:MAG: Na/Pi cotransporter family protein [Treponema sp.]|jgi:phosphate:Na+ symporter|nr:Na/Pi cotransporter family protein [Treponema sp.]